MSDFEFCVITKVPGPGEWGNLASLVEVYVEDEAPSAENNFQGVCKQLHEVDRNLAMFALLKMRVPVFDLGEIIVLDRSGREIGARGRKPAKWLISFETFNKIEDAAARALEVLG